MYIYLPIAEISMNVLTIIGLGGMVGFLSGVFGVGGGFLMTPLLIFLGVPAPVAVGTEANQIVASSVSGVLAHFRRGNVDFKMGMVLLAGGLVGSTLGVALFALLRQLGQIDVVIKLSFIVFLGIIGSLMLIESVRAMLRTRLPGRAAASCTSTTGCMACPSKCGSENQSFTSLPCCPSWLARWSAFSPRSWGLAAALSWCRQ